MEQFKAVEKEMKTKAFSKEGLMASSKLDPKEREKLEMVQYLSNNVEELERQVETLEAETETLHGNAKSKKKDNSKAERVAELERAIERHKFHMGKMELIQRSLENGSASVDQINELKEGIDYYVNQNQDVDFMEDEELYDDLDLQGDEELYGMGNELDKTSSQDAQSVTDELPEIDKTTSANKSKAAVASEQLPATARRPSTHQMKSPLPSLAQLHQPLPTTTMPAIKANDMKPAPLPKGEPLKYASAAAAAAASDKSGVGIAPLPPPPGIASAAPTPTPGLAPLPAPTSVERTASPATSTTQTKAAAKSPAPSHASAAAASASEDVPPVPSKFAESKQLPTPESDADEQRKDTEADVQPPTPSLTNGETGDAQSEAGEESIYHLPSSLQDLLESLESTKSNAFKEMDERLLAASYQSAPDSSDAERPRNYRPSQPNPYTPSHYPQEPSPIFDDPRLFQQIDQDTLFYAFYYRQGAYQQYLAAKALKAQSWRFHKQYQTWFQRHEEPKQITEEYEQGTYRFFDYESTW